MRAAAPALLLLSLLLLLMAPPLWALGYTGTQLAHEDFADLGAVALLVPAGPARDLVIVLDDDAEIPAALYGLANRGHLVAHVPLKHFLESAAARRNACLDAVTLLDVFSQHLQQKFRFAHYQRPLLVGLGAAAPFALATIAQAPGRLFQAGAGVNTERQIELPAPPCAAAPLSVQRLDARHFRIAPPTPRPAGSRSTICTPSMPSWMNSPRAMPPTATRSTICRWWSCRCRTMQQTRRSPMCS